MDVVFLTPSIHTGSAALIWPAMAREAKAAGDRLFLVPGGRLGSQDVLDAQKNKIYEEVQRLGFGRGIVWTSALSGGVSKDGISLFLKRFSFGLTCIGHEYSGYPAVVLDTYGAMQELLAHLFDVHGYRRFLFIRGPEGHMPAADRFLAFNDFVEQRNLDWNEQYVSQPVAWTAGAQAVRQTVETHRIRPGRDFDVLLGASDLLVYDAILEMESLGYSYPEDFAAAGFNNSPESRLLNPGFTTLHMPFDEAGRLAFQRWGNPGTVVLKPRLVVRKSCGCFPHSFASGPPGNGSISGSGSGSGAGDATWRDASARVLDGGGRPGAAARSTEGPGAAARTPSAAARTTNGPANSHAGDATGHAYDAIARDAGGSALREEGGAGPGAPADPQLEAESEAIFLQRVGAAGQRRAAELTAALLESVKNARPEVFLGALDRELQREGDGSLTLWQDCLTRVRELCRDAGYAGEGPAAMFDQARILVTDALDLLAVRSSWQESQISHALYRLDQRLLGLVGYADLSMAMFEVLPELDVYVGYVVLSGDPAHVAAGFSAGRALTGPVDLPPGRLLPDGLTAQLASGSTSFILPLCDESKSYGYAVIGLGRMKAEIYEHIRTSLTGAVRSLVLLDQVRFARDQARKAQEIKSSFLAHASAELLGPLQALRLRMDSLLPGGDQETRRELEALMHLTRDLGDFSRAEVEDLDLAFRAMDLRRWLQSLDTEGEFSLVDEDPERQVPCVDADPNRLGQVLRGLAALATDRVRGATLGFRLGADGKGVSLALRASARGADFRTREGISMTLYKRILMLHGGSLELDDETIRIVIPFPRFAAQAPTDPDSEIRLLGASEGALAAKIDIDWALLEDLGAGESSRVEVSSVDAVLFDIGSASPQDWGLLRKIRNSDSLRRLPVLCYGGQYLDEYGLGPEALGSLLFGLLSERSPGPALFFHGGQGVPAGLLDGSGLDLMSLSDLEDLGLIPQELSPKLVLVSRIEYELLRALKERWPRVPMVLLADDFTDLVLDEELSQWLYILCLHKGIFPVDQLSKRLVSFVQNPEELAPQTGLLVKKAVLYFDRHFSQPISRWQLAESVHVSEDYLTRIFHKEMGISPWDYLIRLRIARGGQLLRTTNLSIQEVAQRVGIDDQAYFCRVFRKLRDATPSRYRSMARTS